MPTSTQTTGLTAAIESPASPQPGALATEGVRKRIPAPQAWQGLKNPASSGEFYASWLALLCSGVRGTTAGILLMRSDDGAFIPTGIWPDTSVDPGYLKAAAERALLERTSVFASHPRHSNATKAATRVQIAHPIVAAGDLLGVVVVDLVALQESEWRIALEQISWAVGWPEALFWRHKVQAQSEPRGDVPL